MMSIFLLGMLVEETIPQYLRGLLSLSAKLVGIGIYNPTTTVDESHKALLGTSKQLLELLLTRETRSYV